MPRLPVLDIAPAAPHPWGMPDERPAAVAPRPVAFGCTMAAFAVGILVLFVILAAAFLESGADTGETVLEVPEAYARGSFELNPRRGFYFVRLIDGEFLALNSLDAANRAAEGQRCRVAPLPSGDPALPDLLKRYAARLNPQAAGTTVLFREDCNGAVYDVTGLRLDAEGPNLDRHPVTVRADGRLSVDVSKRLCTRREGSELFAPLECP